MEEHARPAIGMDVIDNADRMVGTVETVEHDHFVVEKGFFFPQSHRIPVSAIGSINNNEIILRISREEAISTSVDHHWSDDPHHGESVPDKSDTEKSAIEGGIDPHKI